MIGFIFVKMTYQQTIDFLFAQLPMYSRIGAAAYKADLDNTIALCNALQSPHTKFKSIHIAGTNGKGSTSHMLAAILQQAGYKTGLYTSPHLKDFRERIKINGEMVSEDFVVDFVERTSSITAQIEPSFFELTMCMAFDYFAQQKVDIAIIETGLGGRLDSTNIIEPILSIITNIGYDHMNILGDTLAKIAAEKAGIIKKNTPVIIGEYLEETKQLFIAKAKECNAPIIFASEDYIVSDIEINTRYLICKVTNTKENCIENYTLDLNGLYQTRNLPAILAAEKIVKQLGFIIPDAAEKFALANTKKLSGLFGRWDVIEQNPTVVLDVAHNEDGIKQVIAQINWLKKYPSSNDTDLKIITTHIIIGMVRDKEITNVLVLLPKDALYYFTNAHIPRAMPAEELKDRASALNLNGYLFTDVNKALEAAKAKAATQDIILVCGSIFLVGEVDKPVV